MQLMNKIIKLLWYSGSKINYVDKINSIIDKSNSKYYYEPFLGSGAVFLNLNKKFEHHFISDINPHLIRIWKSINELNYTDVMEIYNSVINDFGDIGKNKEAYYNFRNWFNENKFKSDSVEEGIYLMILYNSCINSFARYGPTGFNQSFGNRNYTGLYKSETHEAIKNKLKNTTIVNTDFYKLNINSDSILFLDPPYIERPSSYSTLSNNDFNKLMEFIKQTNNEICYTDIEHEFLPDLNKIILRDEMKSTSPNRKTNNTGNTEVMFYKMNNKIEIIKVDEIENKYNALY